MSSSHEAMHGFAGVQRLIEVGIVIAPTRASAPAAAKSLSAFLDSDAQVPVRLAGIGVSDSRIHFTLAVTLGSIDEVKVAGDSARSAVLLLQRLVDEFAAYDPSFTILPEASSAEARLAEHLTATATAPALNAVVDRLLVG